MSNVQSEVAQLVGQACILRGVVPMLLAQIDAVGWTGQAAAALVQQLLAIKASLDQAAAAMDRAASTLQWAHHQAATSLIDAALDTVGDAASTVTHQVVDAGVDMAVEVGTGAVEVAGVAATVVSDPPFGALNSAGSAAAHTVAGWLW